jgi:BirA family biotin operon repressor/biotin-[acetyl-CoA-carboxylase] ligase
MLMKPNWQVVEYTVTGSTNDDARRMVEEGSGPWLAVRADHQVRGRGRYSRRWMDKPGKSLLMTAVLPEAHPFRVSTAVCLAVREAVRAMGGEGPLFKWPNDLVYPEGKVGGLLCESVEGPLGRLLLAGLGINVSYGPGELEVEGGRVTSLWVSEKRLFGVEELFWEILERLPGLWREDANRLRRRYQENMADMGQEVVLAPPYRWEGEESLSGEVRGVVLGVDEEGRLLLEGERGVLRVLAGDVMPV